MNKKIIFIVLILAIFLSIAMLLNNIVKINPKDYGIEEIMQSNIIFRIDANFYGSDIDLYSYKDEEGNEWIYRKAEHHLVLTKDGILCKYITGSYREEIPYSGYEIIKCKNLSKSQVKRLTEKIKQLENKEFNNMIENIEYRLYQNGNSKTIKLEDLNKILSEYEFNMLWETNS